MPEPQWHLEMSMIGPFGERYTMAVELDQYTAGEVHKIEPPMPGLISFSDAVNIFKHREFRKDLFIKAAHRLGAALAERMEDREGWHGVERQDKVMEDQSYESQYIRRRND